MMLMAAARVHATEDSLRFGPFGEVHLYYESPHAANVVLFISGDGGWNLGVVDMARALASLDAVVSGVDITHYLRALEGSREECLYPAGDLENLSKVVQQHLNAPAYTTPVLVGYSSGATLVYAVLAQSPPNTFKGAVSLGFCPDLPLTRPMCHGDGLNWGPGPGGKGVSFLPASTIKVPWVALQGTIDRVCSPEDTRRFVSRVTGGEVVMLPNVGHGFSVQRNWMPQFKAAFVRIAASGDVTSSAAARDMASSAAARDSTARRFPAQPGPRGLPLIEISGAPSASNTLAIILSGDGGWGTTEQGISRDLVAGGIAVVGWNSLHYYWKKRTPEEAARDLERIARYYLQAWHKTRLVLAGYSFGADVLPFLASRLPADLRGAVASIVLIGMSHNAEFEFHFGDWIGRGPTNLDYPTIPELGKLRGMKIFCFYGKHDSDILCSEIDSTLAQCMTLPGGHRVGGNYAPISKVILEQARGRKNHDDR
jgi:type IV secretory pathway VirJ component